MWTLGGEGAHHETVHTRLLQLLQPDDMHPIRPVCSLTRARVGNPLPHSAHQPEHHVVLLEHELLFDLDIPN